VSRSYSRDPFWIVTRYKQTDKTGRQWPAGTRAFYFPLSRTVLFGDEAEAAARHFAAERDDEAFNGAYYQW
jgi:hypothetical protein